MIMGVLGVWYNNFFGAQSHTLLPYDQVRQLTAHLSLKFLSISYHATCYINCQSNVFIPSSSTSIDLQLISNRSVSERSTTIDLCGEWSVGNGLLCYAAVLKNLTKN